MRTRGGHALHDYYALRKEMTNHRIHAADELFTIMASRQYEGYKTVYTLCMCVRVRSNTF